MFTKNFQMILIIIVLLIPAFAFANLNQDYFELRQNGDSIIITGDKDINSHPSLLIINSSERPYIEDIKIEVRERNNGVVDFKTNGHYRMPTGEIVSFEIEGYIDGDYAHITSEKRSGYRSRASWDHFRAAFLNMLRTGGNSTLCLLQSYYQFAENQFIKTLETGSSLLIKDMNKISRSLERLCR